MPVMLHESGFGRGQGKVVIVVDRKVGVVVSSLEVFIEVFRGGIMDICRIEEDLVTCSDRAKVIGGDFRS